MKLIKRIFHSDIFKLGVLTWTAVIVMAVWAVLMIIYIVKGCGI